MVSDVESTAAGRPQAPVRLTRRAKVWRWFEMAVWSLCIAVGAWKTVPLRSGSAFMVCLGVWGLFRLATAVALYRVVDRFAVAATERKDVVAGWLYMARPAANGAFFASLGVLSLAQWNRIGLIVGAVLLTVGLSSLMIGLWLLRGWRRNRIAALQ